MLKELGWGYCLLGNAHRVLLGLAVLLASIALGPFRRTPQSTLTRELVRAIWLATPPYLLLLLYLGTWGAVLSSSGHQPEGAPEIVLKIGGSPSDRRA